MDQIDFFNKYNISEKAFEDAKLKWKDLIKIADDYQNFIDELKPSANYLVETIHNLEKVHSVKYRLKDKEHLIEKIIRKRFAEPNRKINLTNYKEEITDLIGIRILHLFKEDWEFIHQSIKSTWELKEDPIAYYRKGDTQDYIDKFKKYDCKVEEHPHGYRSVHYLIKTTPNRNTYIAEIQVRTIFEEAWSEIDHQIHYPYNLNNVILNQFLVLFNRFAGSADEMGSYVIYLKKELARIQNDHSLAMDEQTKLIAELKEKITELKLKPIEMDTLNYGLDNILKMQNAIDLTDYSRMFNTNIETFKVDYNSMAENNFRYNEFRHVMDNFYKQNDISTLLDLQIGKKDNKSDDKKPDDNKSDDKKDKHNRKAS